MVVGVLPRVLLLSTVNWAMEQQTALRPVRWWQIISASKSSIRRFVITEKAPTRAVIAAFNQEKVLVGAFSVITNLRMELFEALALQIMPGITKEAEPIKIRCFRPYFVQFCPFSLV